ncbi:MAG TPA: hypothetical protein VEA69_11675 [Tepidisphaeraceae bacterium]|nr:hypothetical protein [Tepidisphaeraceae bacterium]
MSGKRAAPTKLVLREDFFTPSAPLKVDREKGVIYGVKLLGWRSSNHRFYKPEAGKDAVARKVYEGAKVFWDHPRRPEDPRESEDGFGKLRNVEWREDGLYADLHFFTTDPLAAKLCEDVERGIGFFGLSHNAECEIEMGKDGEQVITRIGHCRSVDIVSEAATVSNLWESARQQKPMKFKAFFEAVAAKLPAKAGAIQALLEDEGDMPMMDADVPGEMPADGADSGDWRKKLADVVGELAASDDAEAHDLAGKIMKLLKPESAEVVPPVDDAAALGEEDGDEEKDAPVEESCDEPKKMEGKKPSRRTSRKASDPAVAELQEQLAALTAQLTTLTEEKKKADANAAAAALQLWVKEQCESRKLPAEKALVETCLRLADRKLITNHLDFLKTIAKPSASAPRSQSPHRFVESSTSTAARDGKTLAELLKTSRN